MNAQDCAAASSAAASRCMKARCSFPLSTAESKRSMRQRASCSGPRWRFPRLNPARFLLTRSRWRPRVAKGKVFIGNAGGEFPPFRGYVSAFDVNNGKELWKFYTVPGDPSKAFENKAMEAAAKTWTGEWWKYGRRRIDLGRHGLRSGRESALRRNRQWSALAAGSPPGKGHAAPGQPLRRVHHCDQCRYRSAEVALLSALPATSGTTTPSSIWCSRTFESTIAIARSSCRPTRTATST